MRRLIPVMLALLTTVSAPTATLAAAPATAAVTADLDGVPIAASEIPAHYCHDRDFPRVHCFLRESALQDALLDASAAASGATDSLTAASSSDYVIVYSGLSYGGTYMYISQNYDTLFFVNWNDRIRSYRSLNGASGTFWTDWYATGYDLTFCCGASATSLSSRFDRQITSVYRH